MNIRIVDRFLRAPDDGGAGGASGGSGGAGAQGAAGGQGAQTAGAGGAAGAGEGQAGGGAGPQPYRPDGLPDHFFGKDDRETVDKLYGAVKGFREQQGDIPADAKGYKFEPSDVVKPYAGGLENDPFFDKVRAAAHEFKIPSKAFNGFLNKVMGEMVAGEMMAEPFSADKERALMVPTETDPQKRAAEADRIVRENAATIDTWKQQGLPPAAADWMSAHLDRAAVNQLVGWARGLKGEQSPALGGNKGGGVTEADLNARIADPRGQVGGPKFDKAFVEETDRLFKAFYGDGSRA